MIANVTLTETAQNIIDVPAGKSYTSVCIFLCNTHASEVASLEIYGIASGGAGATNVIATAVAVDPKDTITFEIERIVLGENQKIAVKKLSSDGVVVATPSWMDMSS